MIFHRASTGSRGANKIKTSWKREAMARQIVIPPGATVRKFNRAALPKQARQEANESELEVGLMRSILLYATSKGFPAPRRQVAFDSTARRLDFGFEGIRLGVEVQGGTMSRNRGKHSRGLGQHRDFQKLNAAALAGWSVLQFDAIDLEPKNIVKTIETIYAAYARLSIRKAAENG